jgi:hypothetical protein
MTIEAQEASISHKGLTGRSFQRLIGVNGFARVLVTVLDWHLI